ncbi:MAG: DUF1232 domain-containing protein [Verrucomicrobiaceae bacterium]|nr:DUF1232 domain-containing protein [Verrucomicrobiaceae bacterium]
MNDNRYDDTIHEVNEKADEIGSKFHKQKALKSLLAQGMVMIDLVKDYATGRYREVPYWAMGATALALFYVLSPIDVIPDVIVGAGFLDDAVVVSFALKLIEKELTRYKEWKDRQQGKAAPVTGKVVDV